MGHLVGIPYFFTEDSFYQEKEDITSVWREKKLDNDRETLLVEQVQAVKQLQSHLMEIGRAHV